MEKEEKIIVILLMMALSSLFTAYFCFGPGISDTGNPSGLESRQYTPEAELGDRVSLEAEVLSKHITYTGGHLLLTVECGSEVLPVFIPSGAGAEILDESIQEGDMVRVSGIVAEYEGEREIKVEKVGDISRITVSTVNA